MVTSDSDDDGTGADGPELPGSSTSSAELVDDEVCPLCASEAVEDRGELELRGELHIGYVCWLCGATFYAVRPLEDEGLQTPVSRPR